MPTVLSLSPEQKTAHDAILDFVKEKRPQLRIGGFAGTGKTYLIAHTLKAIRELDKKKLIALACFTGKAAFVLREKLTAAEALEDEYCGTIHGLMYEPVVKDGVVIKWRRRDKIEADLIIIDEASMVSEQIYKDLQKYKVPMLFIGDHGQLPPIGGQLSLMEKPDVALTQIQRQAAGNPIIALSVVVRESGEIPSGESITSTMGWRKVFLNAAIRNRLGFGGINPMVTEKLICLKNNREEGIFNGMGGILQKINPAGPDHYDVKVQMEDGTTFRGFVIKDQFGAQATLREHEHIDPRDLKELFDFGYALTVHKAQGSEADRVFLIEERFSSMTDEDWRRWLYTGVTRARKHLTVVSRVR